MRPAELAENFELLISAYELAADGKLLIQWFREDWGIFDLMDDSRAKDLLAEVLNDGEIVRQLFLPVNYSAADPLSEWEKLREELMYQNRFFPVSDIDLEHLQENLSWLELDSDEIPTSWYRARIQTG
ncbi:MAG: RES domain-containing protein, partial [Pyrinomonadaceae bacterium]